MTTDLVGGHAGDGRQILAATRRPPRQFKQRRIAHHHEQRAIDPTGLFVAVRKELLEHGGLRRCEISRTLDAPERVDGALGA